jgi:hypothetical protein
MPAPPQQGGSQAGRGRMLTRIVQHVFACRLTSLEYLSERAGNPMTPEPHRTTRQASVERNAEPAICAVSASSGGCNNSRTWQYRLGTFETASHVSQTTR